MTRPVRVAARDWSALSDEHARAAARLDPVVVLPLAATEQHGPHLPASTDVDIGVGLLDEAVRRLPADVEVWTLPPVPVGASQEHERFAGTLSVSTEELIGSIVDTGARLARAGVRRLVLSNSHGGNRHAMEAAALALRSSYGMLVVKASWFRFPRPPGVDLPEVEWRHGLHGGALETAMMLHLRPELVRRDAVADFPSLGAELETELRRLGPEGEASFAWLAGDLNPLGVTGNATLASAEMGRSLVEHYGQVLAEVILDARDFRLERLEAGTGATAAAAGASAPVGSRATLGEQVAWELVRGLVPGSASVDTPVRVRAPSAPGAWIDVDADGTWRASGPVSDEARHVLDIFVPIRVGPDIVVGQLGQSLDGRIATESGASHFVTGHSDIERLHRLRALVDAVIVGASTVEHDDPRLTVRLVEGADPVRVVLDPSGRLDEGHRVFADAGSTTTLVVRGEDGGTEGGPSAEGRRAGVGSPDGCEALEVPWAAPGELDLFGLLERLRAMGLRRILVEGGGVTVSRFLAAGLLDRLHVTVAPMLIGSGRPSVSLDPIESLDQALRPAWRRFSLGDDVLFDLDLRSASR